MFRLGSEENEYTLCPYDKVHKIRKARMQVHLIKCRKNHPAAAVATCPFNVLHVVNELELDFHVTICPERMNFELFCHRDDAPTTTAAINDNAEKDQASQMPVQNSSSTWDADSELPTYNPANYVQQAAVLRDAKGLTPSERRFFREQERKRLSNLPGNK